MNIDFTLQEDFVHDCAIITGKIGQYRQSVLISNEVRHDEKAWPMVWQETCRRIEDGIGARYDADCAWDEAAEEDRDFAPNTTLYGDPVRNKVEALSQLIDKFGYTVEEARQAFDRITYLMS